MKVALIQYDIAWENPSENRSKIDRILKEQKVNFDLLVLPEMFNTGFSMDTHKNHETMDGPTVAWMKELSTLHQIVVTGSLIIKEGDNYYNRLLWVRPDGSSDFYDKKHLFTLAKEDHYFAPGEGRKVFQLEVEGVEWSICPLICYDLRFPVWSRNTVDYDLLIYVANFPEKRGFAWSQLLVARAIENQCYTIGVNRIGTDGKDIPYSGDSVVLDYLGHSMLDAGNEEGIFYVNLSKDKLVSFRRAYNFLRDRDPFEIT